MKKWASALAGVFLLAVTTVPAMASLMTHEFTVQATNGPRIGESSTGTFTYDSSSVPAALPGAAVQIGLLTDFAFTWDGVDYDEATANTGRLEFDITGNLVAAVFGDDCFPGVCWVTDTAGPNWYVAWGSNYGNNFSYSSVGIKDIFVGTVSLDDPSRVPEPATLALLGLGLAGLGVSRRKQ